MTWLPHSIRVTLTRLIFSRSENSTCDSPSFKRSARNSFPVITHNVPYVLPLSQTFHSRLLIEVRQHPMRRRPVHRRIRPGDSCVDFVD